MDAKTVQELADRFDAIIKEKQALQSKIDGLMDQVKAVEAEKALLNQEIDEITAAYAAAKRTTLD